MGHGDRRQPDDPGPTTRPDRPARKTALLSARLHSKVNGAAKDTVPPPSPRSFNGFSEITSFIWGVADLLRGDYKQADYGKFILPLTVLRRLDCVLEKTKAKVLAKHADLKQAKHPEGTIEKMLLRASGTNFYNTSKLDFEKLKGDPNHIATNLTSYIKGFSEGARDVIEQFKFADQIAKLDESNLLFSSSGALCRG
jgi:type I restriction-modification system DNA methylase subunit